MVMARTRLDIISSQEEECATQQELGRKVSQWATDAVLSCGAVIMGLWSLDGDTGGIVVGQITA
jgi:hypothetical protein